mgnify:CR=1 FL=1
MTSNTTAVEVLRRRLGHLVERIEQGRSEGRRDLSYDRAEVAALRRAIEQLETHA